MTTKSEEPKCVVCGKYAEFESPNDLCKECWNKWWNFEIEIPPRKSEKDEDM